MLYTTVVGYIQCRGGSRIFARGGGGGGAKGRALIIMVWARLRNIARKMYLVSGASPQSLFTVIMLLRRVFVVFISSARHKTPPLVAMKFNF